MKLRFHILNERQGFTLIEMSIVLVLIGLLIGGILTGRDLIFSSQIRQQIQQMSELESRINAFQGKYDCLPGDCLSATTYLGTTYNGNVVKNGDGNGFINATTGSGGPFSWNECLMGDGTSEISQLFMQLNAAALGKYASNGNSYVMNIGFPEAALGNGMFVTCLTSVAGIYVPINHNLLLGNVIVLGASPSLGGISSFRIAYSTGLSAWKTSPYSSNLGISAVAAKAIDSKIDDGIYNTGTFGMIYRDNGVTCTSYNLTTTPGTACQMTVGKLMKGTN